MALSEGRQDDSAGSDKTVRVSVAGKQPPEETKEDTRRRRWIIISLWAIIALFGLPAWYATTTVPRAELPLDAMNRWAEGQGCSLEFPLQIALDTPSFNAGDGQRLSRMVQTELDQQNDSKLHSLHVVPAVHDPLHINRSESEIHVDTQSSMPIRHQLTVEVKEAPKGSPQTPTAKLEPFHSILRVYFDATATSDDRGMSDLAHFISEQLQSIFAEERATIAHLLTGEPAFARNLGIQDQSTMSQDLKQRSNRAFKYASTYHLTFSLFSGSASPSSWDIKEALDEYLKPFLEAFASISTFTVDTQVQLYASLSPSLHGPTYDETTGQWSLLQSDLSAFINAAEWPLSPSIGAGPTINFVVYVPSEDQSPLVIRENGGTSWLIPQWGGVQIVNTGGSSNHSALSKESLEPVIRIFADQLESLLGLPRVPSSLPLRLSSLTRERTAALILSTSSTLGALARLTLKLTAIAIPDNVSKSVSTAIQHLEQACEALHQSRFDSALEHARIAESEAEHAFFDPSMVGQVYFPDEHKVAVYVPLLGPMAVPLIMAAVKEVKRIQQTRSFSH